MERGLTPAAPRRMVRAVLNYYYCPACEKYFEEVWPGRHEGTCSQCLSKQEPYYVDGEGKKS